MGKERGEEEASTSKMITATTTETPTGMATTKDTSSRRQMRVEEVEEVVEGRGRRGDTRRRARTTHREEVRIQELEAAGVAVARISMRKGLHQEEIAEAMAQEEAHLHREATAGDIKARVDRLGLTWGEEVGRGVQIQVVSFLGFPCTEAATDNE
jgi:type IV pilus biogenesis protein CpaD/CtpE